MTVNSIDYITKKHFRAGLSVLVTLTAFAVAGLSGYLSVSKGMHTGFAAFAVFAGLSAVFRAITLFSPRTGSTLLRLSVSVNALVCFFAAMGLFTLGYLFFRHDGTQDRVNELLASVGYNTIATQPEVTGALLFAASVLLYMASGCAFFCHRTLGAVKSCASGTLKRSGFRIYPVLSVILFLLATGAAAALLLLSCSAFLKELLSDRDMLLTALLMILLLLHLLLSGLCAGSFARKTFAFKVFEKQIMKVETNADGTVYVPIREDRDPGAEEPLLPAKKKADREEPDKKGFIREFSPAAEEAAERSAAGEGFVL